MKGQFLIWVTAVILLAVTGGALSLQLPGQAGGKSREKEGTWLTGGKIESIPIWSFLPRNQDNQHSRPTKVEARNSHGNKGYVPDNDSDEILMTDDLSSLLSSKARLLNNSKRSPSYATGGDSSRKIGDVKRSRPYDVPLIECPLADDGMERFSCPTPDAVGRYRCVDDHVLCDGFIDCPNAEDEDRQACMFYKTTKAHLDVLADALLRWARGR